MDLRDPHRRESDDRAFGCANRIGRCDGRQENNLASDLSQGRCTARAQNDEAAAMSGPSWSAAAHFRRLQEGLRTRSHSERCAVPSLMELLGLMAARPAGSVRAALGD
jgi:hypothetical protein